MNFFLLSTYAPTAKKNKFSIYLAFRKALCKGLFTHTKPHSTVIMADPVTVVVTNRVAVGTANTVGTRVKHQRVKIKRLVYIIYKYVAVEKRREIK